MAHRLSHKLADPKTAKRLPYLLPDGKTQVGIAYKDGRPERIHSITLVASQIEAKAVKLEQLSEDLVREVVIPVFKKMDGIQPDERTQVFINPEGIIIGGGPSAHSGLTGRKTSNDTYGAYARQSGAALSGKGPMRIDRVGAYAARYAAKNVVAAGLARECEVQLSYSIGVSAPVSVRVRTFGTGDVDDIRLTKRVAEVFDFRLGAILRDLRLLRLPAESRGGFYQRLAVYGHMGRTDIVVPWEQTDRAGLLKE
jgi:S-adenosylmethionine synthetase